MKKSFKIALLGCASSCLMSAAYAHDLQISDIVLSDAVCGSEERSATVKITNVSHDRIKIKGASISIDEDDTFPQDRHAVKFYPGTWDKFWKSCFLTDVLKPGHSCLGTVELDPEELSCADDAHPLVADGDIERTLKIKYTEYTDGKSDHHYEVATAPIDTNITLSGAFGQSYALLADYITVHDDSKDEAGVLTMTTVEGNVSAADHNDEDDGDLDDVFYNCENQSCGYVPFPESEDAFADVEEAYDIFRNAVFDYKDPTDCENASRDISLDELGDASNPIYPGFYCVIFTEVDEASKTAIYAMEDSKQYHFRGDEDDVFVFAFPDEPTCLETASSATSPTCTDEIVLDTTEFYIREHSSFDITSDSMGASVEPKNMFWVLPRNSTVIVEDGIRFAGNIITAGEFVPYDETGYHAHGAPYFRGGVYGLTDDLDESKADAQCDNNCHDETRITTNGFTFDNDFNDN